MRPPASRLLTTAPLRVSLRVSLCAAALLATACAVPPATAPIGSADPGTVLAEATAAGLPVLRPVVLDTLPHDPTAWTQGLEIAGDTLYEGTGQEGRSRLRELDPATGLARREVALPDNLYGEGITVLPDRIWQLTWRDGVVLGWARDAARVERRVPWTGEGWGLCHTGDGRVVASDGTARLRVLDGDLTPLGVVDVRAEERPVGRLNELECVGPDVWANVWETDWIVRIDLASGAVTAAVDASALLPTERRGEADVLNGIAAVPGSDGEFLLTGKLWPTLFRVRFAG